MKTTLLTAFAIVLFTSAFAAPKKYRLLRSTSSWTTSSNWSPTGYPVSGDTVLIPTGIQLTLANDITLSGIYIDIYGSVVLAGNNLKATLTGNSIINVHTGATLHGDKASQQLILNGIIYKGKDPVVTGPKMATRISNGFRPYVEFNILPVTFTSFTVARSGSAFIIQWATTNETGASHYEIERSNDGVNWNRIARVGVAGNSTNTYSYADKAPTAGTVHYRIKQVDADGSEYLTAVRTVTSGTAATTEIRSVRGTVVVNFPQQLKGTVKIEVIGLNGHVALSKTIAQPIGTQQLATPLKGIYIVRISNGNDLNQAKQIVL